MQTRTRPDPSLARASRLAAIWLSTGVVVASVGVLAVVYLFTYGMYWFVSLTIAAGVMVAFLCADRAAVHLLTIRDARNPAKPRVVTAADLLALADATGVGSQFSDRQAPSDPLIARRSADGRVLGRRSVELRTTATTALRVVKP